LRCVLALRCVVQTGGYIIYSTTIESLLIYSLPVVVLLLCLMLHLFSHLRLSAPPLWATLVLLTLVTYSYSSCPFAPFAFSSAIAAYPGVIITHYPFPIRYSLLIAFTVGIMTPVISYCSQLWAAMECYHQVTTQPIYQWY
jgi:hypothetical protein